MNHYDWTEAVIDHTLRIEKHNSRDEFSDSIPRLRAFLEKEPFIHDDDEAVYVDVGSVIRTIEARPGLNHEEITQIVMQGVVKRTRESHNGIAQRIIPMNEPGRSDDWSTVIKQTVTSYEAVHNCTPDEGQLWTAMKENALEEWSIEYQAEGNQITSQGIDKPLSRRSFKGRYNRYYPKK